MEAFTGGVFSEKEAQKPQGWERRNAARTTSRWQKAMRLNIIMSVCNLIVFVVIEYCKDISFVP